jgi:antitoxin component YwqK of YwqJK toxin-antitoxin module
LGYDRTSGLNLAKPFLTLRGFALKNIAPAFYCSMRYLLPFLLLPLAAHAQRNQRIITYFDSTKIHPREIFRALVARDTVMEGPYKRFYPNGRLEAQTRYTDGKRDSVYVEFHANRGRRLEATYVAGVRQGPFKTYYPDGKVAQVGSFLDDEPNGSLTTYYQTGEIKLQTTLVKGQPTGAVRELYASGQPAAEVTYLNGQPNGAVKFFFPNGKVQSEGTLRGGLLSGSYKTYYDTGQLESETVLNDQSGKGTYRSYYVTGQLQTEGNYAPAAVQERAVTNKLGDDLTKRVAPRTGTAALDGLATSYYPSGKLKSKTTYRLGVPTGRALDYYESGQLKEETDYSAQGRDHKTVRYYDTATPTREAEEQYRSNHPVGTWHEYFPDGKTPRKVETYAPTGKLQGERLTYFENGQVQTRQQFENGLQTGLGEQFFATGKLWKEGTYLKGLLSGPYRELREDGTQAEAGQYKNGKTSGQWTYYKADGQGIDHQVTFRDGKPLGTATRTKLNGKPFVAPKPKAKK